MGSRLGVGSWAAISSLAPDSTETSSGRHGCLGCALGSSTAAMCAAADTSRPGGSAALADASSVNSESHEPRRELVLRLGSTKDVPCTRLRAEAPPDESDEVRPTGSLPDESVLGLEGIWRARGGMAPVAAKSRRAASSMRTKERKVGVGLSR